MDLKEYLRNRQGKIEATLKDLLPAKDTYPEILHEAMGYSVFAGGKRLRPILCLAACEAVKGSLEEALPVACALEIIHTYSLIHDDLPAMDNDVLRRGKPTNHIVFGEANAILAGDALLTLAFQIIGEAGLKSAHKYETYLEIIKDISIAVGSLGMIGGQVVDILSENQEINLATLKYIHQSKTGALIKTSLKSGALLGAGNKEQVRQLVLYGEYLGLAFQITDDLLDVLGNAEKLGKPVGSDNKNQKSTYPNLFGIEKTKELAEEAVNNAVRALQDFGSEGDVLRSLAEYLLIREN